MEYARGAPESIANTMTIDADLARLALQEERLQPDAFDQRTGWALGRHTTALGERPAWRWR